MGHLILTLCSLAAGYLIGAIPFAVLIARSRGVDIFKVGSGNPGATNVLRTLGKPAGYICFVLDAFKGTAAVLIGWGMASMWGSNGEWLAIAALVGAIAGHSFSIFLRFRGGKGVATTVGGLLALLPAVILVGVVLWLIVFYASRFVSLASIVLGLSLPFSALFFGESRLAIGLCLVLTLLILIRHRTNIDRLLKGTENRIPRRNAP
jgi:acyl phosphate:glycerol-3-phosphate acyltransferase